MGKKFKEWLSVFVVKKPDRAIILGILLLNVLLLVCSALLISVLSPTSLKHSGFWESIFYTISMILDAGCIQYVIADIGEVNASLIIVCIVTIILGMVTFTGAVIGSITNSMSAFIEHSKSGTRALKMSGHTIILNWNSRASEIINDLLYTGKREKVVVLVQDGAKQIEKEVDDRLSLTLKTENNKIHRECRSMSFFKRLRYGHRHKLRNRLTLIVRAGDTYSYKQLCDISLLQAKTVIILGQDIQNKICTYKTLEQIEKNEKGNSNTIKTLIQVAEITGSERSADDQVVIVEVDDDRTAEIVNSIIRHKEHLEKCNIVAVPVNKILGQILSQFSIMPELNFVYSELFSNKGAEFFCRCEEEEDENKYTAEYLLSHSTAIPLTVMKTKTGKHSFYIAETEKDYCIKKQMNGGGCTVKINPNYWLEKRNIVIVGHNSNCTELMDGFQAFANEWNLKDGSDILNIIVIDDQKSLEKRDYYKQYSFVKDCKKADVFDGDKIKKAIDEFVNQNEQDTSILILSDDTAITEDIDSHVLTYLIYVQDIILEHVAKDPTFDKGSIDVIVEIVNPKNYDVVHSYDVDNVIISNRYISKMVTQISRKEALYEFYKDILTYDKEGAEIYKSKEMYIKKVSRFFDEVPAPCTAAELVRAVYDTTPENNKSIVVGYVSPGGNMALFTGDQNDMKVDLTEKDKLIIFSKH